MAPKTEIQFEEIRLEKREKILNAALKLFAGNGYHGTSISMIAEEAGISKGLIYSYFKSKEDLLLELFEGYLDIFTSLLNPDNDEEITNEEMERFFRLLKESLIKNNDFWQLIVQLTVQPQVLKLLTNRMETLEILQKHQWLINKYFEQRFENPKMEMLIFMSLIKGFSIVYALTPQMVPEGSVDIFIQRMIKTYITDKIK